MAELIIYVDANFGGLHTHIFESTPDFRQINLLGALPHTTEAGNLGDWNDKVSSFVIISGEWTFFKDINFQTQQGGTLGPGLYSSVLNVGIENDAISSVMLVSG